MYDKQQKQFKHIHCIHRALIYAWCCVLFNTPIASSSSRCRGKAGSEATGSERRGSTPWCLLTREPLSSFLVERRWSAGSPFKSSARCENPLSAVPMTSKSCHFAIDFWCYCLQVTEFSVWYWWLSRSFFCGPEHCCQFWKLAMCTWEECFALSEGCVFWINAAYFVVGFFFYCHTFFIPLIYQFWEACVEIPHGGCLINFSSGFSSLYALGGGLSGVYMELGGYALLLKISFIKSLFYL